MTIHRMTHKEGPNRFSAFVVVSLLGLATLSLAGCHRQYYRKQADCEAHSLIDEKAGHVARSPNIPIRVDVDRRSRMFNPFDVDFQPMPLDDPASYQYMQCVDGRRGYPMWNAAGVTNTAESPDWWQFLPLNEDGVLVLDSDTAVRIALLHSPAYRFQVEQLYLSALAVSAQRFQFDTQYFGGSAAALSRSGPVRSGRAGGRTDVVLDTAGASLSRRFSTGGQLIAGIANSLTWQLSDPDSQSLLTNLSFEFTQPLLRLAGRDFILENLTASERALLANVRSFERFRRSFYLNVTVGRPLESQLNPLVTNIPTVSRGTTNAGGFLGLLQTQLQIRNAEENISRQTENLLLLQDSLLESLTKIPDDSSSIVNDRLQIAQARSRLLSSQSSLVVQQAAFKRAQDDFLSALGLPPYICIELDDPILDRFELIDRRLLLRNDELNEIRQRIGEINLAIVEQKEDRINPDTGAPEVFVEWSDQLASLLLELRQNMSPLLKFSDEIVKSDLQIIQDDIDGLASSIDQRREQTEQLKQLYERERKSICGLLELSDIDESIFEIDEVAGLSDQLQSSYDDLLARLESYKDRLDELDRTFAKLLEEGPKVSDPEELAQRISDEVIVPSQDLISQFGEDVLSFQLIQARARTESVVLPKVDMQPVNAVQIARQHRRDWANSRAALVDAWRLIEVAADTLESDLDLTVAGELGTVGNNPTNFRGSNGIISVGLTFDAPLTRLLERNDYRTSLIQYERAKRQYYQFEDGVWRLLRAEIRQLQANRIVFELGRQAVRIAAQQIELTADRQEINDARGRSLGPTAARDVIDALAALLDAQNGLLNIFVSNEVVRRGLDFDMGTMELTPDGTWIDREEITADVLFGLPGVGDGGMIGCNDCCLPNMRLPAEYDATISIQYSPPTENAEEGLLESDAAIEHDPVHVARIPDAWDHEFDVEPYDAPPQLIRRDPRLIPIDAP